jgi:hypothetical protein
VENVYKMSNVSQHSKIACVCVRERDYQQSM